MFLFLKICVQDSFVVNQRIQDSLDLINICNPAAKSSKSPERRQYAELAEVVHQKAAVGESFVLEGIYL